jgi:hypothetical protein
MGAIPHFCGIILVRPLGESEAVSMPLFSETTLQRMETFWTRRRKEWENKPPAFWLVWFNPSLLLKPTQGYSRTLYFRVALMSVVRVSLFAAVANGLGLAIGALIFGPQFWPLIRDPKNHAYFIGVLSHEGFYQLPLFPLIMLVLSLALHWPNYFFWNRRAKRLQRNCPAVLPVPIVEASVNDSNVWPPAPKRAV